jgi:hypothetical protein
MTKWKKGNTCGDCIFFDFEWLDMGMTQKGVCENQDSDHFAHFLEPAHPECNVFKKRRENEDEI